MKIIRAAYISIAASLLSGLWAADTKAALLTDNYSAASFVGLLTIDAPALLIDSVLAHDPPGPGGFGDGDVLTYLRSGEPPFPGWGMSLVQVGASENCGGATCTLLNGPKGAKGAQYSGLAASIFAIHWGGNDKFLLGLKFASAMTEFSILGFDHDVSFIRAYDPAEIPTQTPLPGAIWLMGTAIAGWAAVARWWGKSRSVSWSAA